MSVASFLPAFKSWVVVHWLFACIARTCCLQSLREALPAPQGSEFAGPTSQTVNTQKQKSKATRYRGSPDLAWQGGCVTLQNRACCARLAPDCSNTNIDLLRKKERKNTPLGVD